MKKMRERFYVIFQYLKCVTLTTIDPRLSLKSRKIFYGMCNKRLKLEMSEIKEYSMVLNDKWIV